MGEAKRRGTFEQRLAAAIQRAADEHAHVATPSGPRAVPAHRSGGAMVVSASIPPRAVMLAALSATGLFEPEE